MQNTTLLTAVMSPNTLIRCPLKNTCSISYQKQIYWLIKIFFNLGE